MTAAPGSKLLADSVGGRTLITYRDQFKPPVLQGTMTPAPLLDTNPSLSGCPVCGNLEIDAGESCDDGNQTSGDGCRADCQDEGCLAQSPGFPSTPMCDDGDGCTLDHCNATTHTCTNVISCEEGVQCTVDACASGSCQHTPDDSLCDDGEECTDDLCNPTSGCVHANLTGGACDDGDFCTPTGTCDAGHCFASAVLLAYNDKLSLKFTAGPDNDRMTAKLSMLSSDVSANPALTGMKVIVVDATGASVYEADLPAANWEDRDGTGQKVRFRDRDGAVSSANGVNSASVNTNTKGIRKVLVKMSGTEIPDAAGKEYLSVSLLFGMDPGTDDCITARLLPCKLTATSSKCSG
jgi:cysteine-rich repeat protein